MHASDVDERALVRDLDRADVPGIVRTLAAAKCAAVADTLRPAEPTLIVGCDSMLELAGQAYGKPDGADDARARWHRMRAREGVLHTGHCVRLLRPDAAANSRRDDERRAVASCRVRFADLADDEVDAYVATGEPLAVAGAFTIDGLGGPYVTGIDGDPHAVVGVSLPLLRMLVRDLGVAWHRLWRPELDPDG